ncbi:ParB/RepB/Spo0J family partition protein [uncultured Actinomyces sp.]|uniref:ParB/RepB/Spo0J family partition protein n=1 Tax=uncultured Actinomyces sp. TaxID=249061 RepID=UPI002631EE5B|nr:ParB/RepB/Spo0J family partition protein [uncultured Actinomyces sp.]
MAEHSESQHKAQRRAGLGRGLGALIPQAQSENPEEVAKRPLDVLFPGQRSSTTTRGGSARELLEPKSRKSTSGRGFTSPKSTRARKSQDSKVQQPSQADVKKETASASQSSAVESFTDSRVDRSDVSRETSELLNVPGATFAEIPLEQIVPNTRQPRQVFDEDDLNELAASIREVGVLQPIVVRRIALDHAPSETLKQFLEEKPEARYELIMGERRLRASELAGLSSIPAIVRHTEDEDLLRDALLENLHRAQLNPLEEAFAYQQLMADFGATQEELSKKIARSRPQIANTLRLLKLPASVQKKVSAQVLSAGHARALLGLSTPEEMEILANRIIAEGLSVRTTEELVRLGSIQRPTHHSVKRMKVASPLGEHMSQVLADAWDTRVTISEGKRKGKIIIEFAGSEDLQRLADLLLPKANRTD